MAKNDLTNWSAKKKFHKSVEFFVCYNALLAGHESFAAAEGALGIVRNANKARKTPLRVILNGLGKDAAYLISRINGFTYIKTRYNFQNQELEILDTRKFSNSYKSEIKVYGCEDVTEDRKSTRLNSSH